ncbi:MAG: hypothetical protein R3261_04630 [Alphaproteobacteria bacterium]|nr:hypothetical protein [Alphaproteobacteria bacterium]
MLRKNIIRFLCLSGLIILQFGSNLALAGGLYQVRINRLGPNQYAIVNDHRIIHTKKCGYHTQGEKAVLVLRDGFSYDRGDLIFKNGKKCAIKEVK